MSRKRSALVLVLVASAMMVVAVATSSAAPKPQTISLFELDTSDATTGPSNQAPSPGAQFVSTGNYYKWAGHKKGALYGHLQVDCTVISISATSGSLQCSATAFFPGGTIAAVGPVNFAAHTNKLPIVGGTGRFLEAQGYVATTSIGGDNSNTSADVIHITN